MLRAGTAGAKRARRCGVSIIVPAGTNLRRPDIAGAIRRGRRCALGLLLAALMPPATAAPETDADAVGPAPAWLRAVGRLQVPGSRIEQGWHRHYREDCSATLVSRGAAGRADVIVTAWHCLEHYRDLARPITFTLRSGEPGEQAYEAHRLADGGGMHADWAILRLTRPVPAPVAAPLGVDPGPADTARPISMVGYPGPTTGIVDGPRLAWDPRCRITDGSGATHESDCIAFKGASGGAVVQLSQDGVPRLTGVISSGDQAGLSRFVPVEGFRRVLERELR